MHVPACISPSPLRSSRKRGEVQFEGVAMAARRQGAQSRAIVRLITALLCLIVVVLLGACGDVPSTEETPALPTTAQTGPSSTSSGAPSSRAPSGAPERSPAPEAGGPPSLTQSRAPERSRAPEAPGGPAAPGG